MARFKPGDVVKLRSGGPCMTIQLNSSNFTGAASTSVICKWFDGPKIEKAVFRKEMVVLVEESQLEPNSQ